MMTVDLRVQHLTIDELLEAAAAEAVHVIAKDGTIYVLEAAEAFEREVAQLGQSKRFMAFLAERAQETGGISLEEAIKRLDTEERQATDEG
jgi:lipopolysaccharide biosynthesis regulator YciM